MIVDNKRTLIPLGLVLAAAVFIWGASADYTNIKSEVKTVKDTVQVHEQRITAIEKSFDQKIDNVLAGQQRIEAKLGTSPK